MTNRPFTAPQYRYAQKDGATDSSAAKSNSKPAGQIKKGTKVRWGAWDAKDRRDEILLNGRRVWTSVTNRHKPAGYTPEVQPVATYARFVSRDALLRKRPRSSPRDKSITTLREGEKVYITGKADGG